MTVELCPLPACRHPKQYHRDVAYANMKGCGSEGCPCPGWARAGFLAKAHAASTLPEAAAVRLPASSPAAPPAAPDVAPATTTAGPKGGPGP